MLQTLEKLFELDRIAQMFHQNIQDDKRTALLALARLMEAAGAQYVVSGGLATQLHVSDPRFTGDVDVVVRSDDAARILATVSQFSIEFELLGQRRHWIRLSHRPSSTPIDVNTSPLFAQVLVNPDYAELAGLRLPIAAALRIAYTKLRTQQPRWPRQPGKRLIDRADLIQLLRDNPGLHEQLQALSEPHLHPLLAEVYAESLIVVDAYPDFDDQEQDEREAP